MTSRFFEISIKKLSICILVILLIQGKNTNIFSQPVTDNQIKSGYIYSYLKYFTWKDELKLDTFQIAMYGEDAELLKVLKGMEKLEAKNKHIKVANYHALADIPYCHILMVGGEHNYQVREIYELIRGRNTLLVTDKCDYQRYVMINFTYNGNSKIQFEINSRNLEEANLKSSPKLILLGGSEIDVRNLYLETEKSLKSEKQKVETFEKELVNKQEEIKQINGKLELLYTEINKLQDNIQLQKGKLANLQQQTDYQLDTLRLKTNLLNQQKIAIYNQEKRLAQRNAELEKTKKQINEYTKTLEFKKLEIANRQNVIDHQGKKISNQVIRIKTQQNFLYLLISLSVMTLCLVLVVYRNYKINRKKNLELEKANSELNRSKNEIQRQSTELFKQANNLIHLNHELELKKNTLEEALQKLKSTQSQLVESEKMVILGQLTAGIAHEINNPINYINSGIEGLKIAIGQLVELLNKYAEVTPKNASVKLSQILAYKEQIEYDLLLADIQHLAKDIKSGVKKTIEIVKGLRTFSRLDETDLKYIDLHQNIESTLVILRNKYSNRIEIEKQYGEIPPLECYPGKINQVLLNILVNAIQAIPENGKIAIITSVVEKDEVQQVKIVIKDSGTGMSAETMNKIFEPFFTTKVDGEGTGLGLSISYSIVEAHHGSISAESEIGNGSMFTIHLPLEHKKKNKLISLEQQ